MKYTWPSVGNQKVIDFLEKNINKKKLSNAYIFCGVRDLGKFSLAKSFARNIFVSDRPELNDRQNLLEINNDFLIIERFEDKKNISIDQIRDLISFLSSSSFLDSYKVVIIKDAENLNQNSANALLKILEDFKDKLVVILTVNNLSNLPETVASRSQIINLYPLNFDDMYSMLKNEYSLSPSEAKNIAKISLGRPMLAKKFIDNNDFYNDYKKLGEHLIDFLDYNLIDRMGLVDNLCHLDSVLGNNLNIVDVWRGLFRDFSFMYYNRPDLIQNDFIIEKIRNKKIEDSSFLLKADSVFKKSTEYLNSNMSLKSVLEYIAVNI